MGDFAAQVTFFFDEFDRSPHLHLSPAMPQLSSAKEECLRALKHAEQLWNKYGMYPGIRRHSFLTAMTAVTLFLHRLEPVGIYRYGTPRFFYRLVLGALLHDIAKTKEIEQRALEPDIRQSHGHAESGYETLKNEDLAFEAVICRGHYSISFVPDLPEPVKLVNCADKLVMHDRPVSIRQRFADLAQRYPAFRSFYSEDTISEYEQYCLLFRTSMMREIAEKYTSAYFAGT